MNIVNVQASLSVPVKPLDPARIHLKYPKPVRFFTYNHGDDSTILSLDVSGHAVDFDLRKDMDSYKLYLPEIHELDPQDQYKTSDILLRGTKALFPKAIIPHLIRRGIIRFHSQGKSIKFSSHISNFFDFTKLGIDKTLAIPSEVISLYMSSNSQQDYIGNYREISVAAQKVGMIIPPFVSDPRKYFEDNVRDYDNVGKGNSDENLTDAQIFESMKCYVHYESRKSLLREKAAYDNKYSRGFIPFQNYDITGGNEVTFFTHENVREELTKGNIIGMFDKDEDVKRLYLSTLKEGVYTKLIKSSGQYNNIAFKYDEREEYYPYNTEASVLNLYFISQFPIRDEIRYYAGILMADSTGMIKEGEIVDFPTYMSHLLMNHSDSDREQMYREYVRLFELGLKMRGWKLGEKYPIKYEDIRPTVTEYKDKPTNSFMEVLIVNQDSGHVFSSSEYRGIWNLLEDLDKLNNLELVKRSNYILMTSWVYLNRVFTLVNVGKTNERYNPKQFLEYHDIKEFDFPLYL